MWKLVAVPMFLLLSTKCFADLTIINTSEACSILSDSGLPGRTWRDQEDGTYGCSSDYLDIGTGFPLANNLAYYVDGTVAAATQMKLVLNVNQPKSKAPATKALLAASNTLAQKALGAKLPPAIAKAIETGKPATIDAGSGSIEVLRDDWPAGKGYEIHVVMK